jgi:hypothetical protein
MPSHPIAVDTLIADLRRVENWLTSSLGVSADSPERQEVPDPFSPLDGLDTLKSAIDRVRPLLWVYLTRQNEMRTRVLRKKSENARSLVEDALTISERCARNNE